MPRGYSGAAASAIACAKRARERYHADPAICKKCGEVIEIREGEKPGVTKKKKFCNRSCSAIFNNQIEKAYKPRVRKSPRTCEWCKQPYYGGAAKQRFCSGRCSSTHTAALMSKEEKLRRGFGDSARSKFLRRRQLDLEEEMAAQLRDEGWEVFSPTVVCDRVGVKDGKVFFIEFKPVSDPRLRPGQKRIADLVPDMYRVVLK